MRIINADVLDGLRSLPDASVQCCVTSPPYWGLRSYLPDGHDDKHLERGLEDTPEAYVARMVEVFRELRRVLRDDGTLWLNLGDSYAQSEVRFRNGSGGIASACKAAVEQVGRKQDHGLKPKDLVGIPWRVAFALQADGWWLRQDIIWHKPNPMPESVRDRCTKAHEYVFLLTKSERYFYDAEAVSEATMESSLQRSAAGFVTTERDKQTEGVQIGAAKRQRYGLREAFVAKPTRNRRSVWTITTKPYSGAHFAVMPPDLVEPCIKAGTSEQGCCPACGTPWERVVDRKPMGKALSSRASDKREQGLATQCGGAMTSPPTCTTLGWRPACTCGGSPVPCTVLDPFAGSGTTLAVALGLGRDAVGIELNPEYVRLIHKRVEDQRRKMGLFAGSVA